MKWLALLIVLVVCGCQYSCSVISVPSTPPERDSAIFSDARREFWLNRFDNLPEPSEVDRAWSRFLLCELSPEQRPEGCE